MKGRVEKRYKKSWTIIIELGYDKATRQRKRIVENYPVETEEEAEGILTDRMYELRHKTFVKRSDMTFSDYLDTWLKFKQSKLAPKTYHSYKSEIDTHIKPYFGDMKLQDVDPIHLQEYYFTMETEGRIKIEDKKCAKKKRETKKKDGQSKRQKDFASGLSQRTIFYHHRIMSMALKQAVKWKMIPSNPAVSVDTPQYKKKEMAVLYKSECEAFIKFAQSHIDFAVIYAAIMTGMRQGEILGLRWIDVDLDAGIINVRKQLQYLPDKGHFFKEPKSEKSKRAIPMQLPLNKMIRDIKKKQEAYRDEEMRKLLETKNGNITDEDIKTIYDDHGLVFCRENGKPWDGGNVSSRFKALIAQFGHPGMRFHDLRHTFAALALAAGVSMDKLQRLMGHESISTTIDMYGHFSQDTLTEEMKKLSNYLGFEALV